MKFFEIGAEVLVPKFTRAEVRLPENLAAVKCPSPNYMQMFYRIGMTQVIDVRVTRCMLRCLMNEPYTKFRSKIPNFWSPKFWRTRVYS